MGLTLYAQTEKLLIEAEDDSGQKLPFVRADTQCSLIGMPTKIRLISKSDHLSINVVMFTNTGNNGNVRLVYQLERLSMTAPATILDIPSVLMRMPEEAAPHHCLFHIAVEVFDHPHFDTDDPVESLTILVRTSQDADPVEEQPSSEATQ